MKKVICIGLLLTILTSCSTKQTCPECLTEKEYVNVYLPVNTCLLDNVTIYKPTDLKRFKFSEISGIMTISNDDLNNLLYNLKVLTAERQFYYDLIIKLKNK